MCFRELEQKLTHACGFIGVRPSNDCKSELIDTPRWSLLKPETLQLLPWKCEGPRSGSLTMTRKMKTSYNVDPVPAKALWERFWWHMNMGSTRFWWDAFFEFDGLCRCNVRYRR